MKSTSEKIEVMQAHVLGKKIQFKYHSSNNDKWRDIDNPNWAWSVCDYRVKSTPREFVLAYRTDTGEVLGVAKPDSFISVNPNNVKVGMISTMHVREVLE